MELLTVRSQIMAIVDRRLKQYPYNKSEILIKLRALNLETATPRDIKTIIGNGSWTNLECNECGIDEKDAVMCLGEPPDYESATIYICLSCLKKALELFSK